MTGGTPESARDAATDDPGDPSEPGDPTPAARAWRVLPNSPAGKYWNHDDVFFVDENTGWVCDISGTIWRTTDGGDSWDKQIDQEGTSFRTLAFLDENRGFVGTLGPGGWVDETQDDTLMYGTSDGGEHWTKVTNIQGAEALRGICGMVTVDDKTIYGVGRYDGPAGFIKTTDGGATWIAKKVKEADGLVDLHFFDAQTGVVGGRLGGGSIILRTTDGGETFKTVATSSSDHIWKIFFLDDKRGYAMISNYALNATRFYLMTEDGGLSWSEVHYSPRVNDYEGLGIGFVNAELGWAAGGAVTYETRDGGKTFAPVNLDPEGGDTINRFFRVGDTMYAVGARVYKYDAINAGSGTTKSLGAASDARLQIAPELRDASGLLSYTVGEPGPVSIGVVSIGGRLIESLVAATMPAGSYLLDYRPDYSQKFVRITMLAGDQRKSVSVVRAGGGEYPKFENRLASKTRPGNR
jgi:photosystem II stability/assembly factor-like uncharacterized protein